MAGMESTSLESVGLGWNLGSVALSKLLLCVLTSLSVNEDSISKTVVVRINHNNVYRKLGT